MSDVGSTERYFSARFRRISPCILPLALLLLAFPLLGQQTDVERFEGYAGYAFLDSPMVSLFENGAAMQFGVNAAKWLAVGVDYSASSGDLTLKPNLLTTSLQTTLAGELGQLTAAGLIPPGYQLTVPGHSFTQTFAAGPQLCYRNLTHITLFLRPIFLGAIHETATAQATNQIQTLVVQGFEALGLVSTAGKKTDSVVFYGFGGGFDILISKHFAWRVQADLVRDHLFSDLLQNARFTTRFSTGPAFHFGKNILK